MTGFNKNSSLHNMCDKYTNLEGGDDVEPVLS